MYDYYLTKYKIFGWSFIRNISQQYCRRLVHILTFKVTSCKI